MLPNYRKCFLAELQDASEQSKMLYWQNLNMPQTTGNASLAELQYTSKQLIMFTGRVSSCHQKTKKKMFHL